MDDLKEQQPDITLDTRVHISRVQQLMRLITLRLTELGKYHDLSKLREPEALAFYNVSSALKGLTYGSPEYKAQLDELRPALNHHYANNPHHPEYWDKPSDAQPMGIQRMSLLSQLEMLADWKAAGERHANGSLFRSFEINRKRFNIPDAQFLQLVKTAFELRWISREEFIGLTCTINL